MKAVATYNNNASLTTTTERSYVVAKIFSGVATVGGHLIECVVGLDAAGGLVSTSPASLLTSETSTSTTFGTYRIRSLRSGTGGVVLDTVTTSRASDTCRDTVTGRPPALLSLCAQTLTPLTTAAPAMAAADVNTAVAATAAVIGVPLAAPICGFNDAPARAQDGDASGIASLARAAQVQAVASYAAAAIHGLSGKKVSIRDAGAAAFSALGTEIVRRPLIIIITTTTTDAAAPLTSQPRRPGEFGRDEELLEAAAAARSGSPPRFGFKRRRSKCRRR